MENNREVIEKMAGVMGEFFSGDKEKMSLFLHWEKERILMDPQKKAFLTKQVHISLQKMHTGQHKKPNARWKVFKKATNCYGVSLKNPSGEYVDITDFCCDDTEREVSFELPFLWISFMDAIQ